MQRFSGGIPRVNGGIPGVNGDLPRYSGDPQPSISDFPIVTIKEELIARSSDRYDFRSVARDGL